MRIKRAHYVRTENGGVIYVVVGDREEIVQSRSDLRLSPSTAPQSSFQSHIARKGFSFFAENGI